MEKTLRVITSDRHSFLSLEKENQPYFKQIEFVGKLLFAGKEQADLEVNSIRNIMKKDDIYEKLYFVVGCLKKRCKDLHYEIYQTSGGHILLYFIAGKCFNNLSELNTFRADYMFFAGASGAEYIWEEETNNRFDYIQYLTHTFSEAAATF